MQGVSISVPTAWGRCLAQPHAHLPRGEAEGKVRPSGSSHGLLAVADSVSMHFAILTNDGDPCIYLQEPWRTKRMLKLILIALGGSAGALMRYVVSGWGQALVGGWFPLGTLVVNVVGCLVIGAAGAYFAGPQLVREEYRLALLVGVLGAFTTFSTFGWETLSLVRDGEMKLALANVLLTNALALLAVWIGYRLTESWFGV